MPVGPRGEPHDRIPGQEEGSQDTLLDQGDRLGRDVAVTEAVDETLVAGMTVTVGSLVFDGSLAAKVRKAIQRARETI